MGVESTVAVGKGRNMVSPNDRSLFQYSFIYDVYRATALLMYLLQEMDFVRSKELPPYDRFPRI